MNLKLRKSINVEKSAVYRPGNLVYGTSSGTAHEIRKCEGFSSTVIDVVLSPEEVYGLGWDGKHLLNYVNLYGWVQRRQGFSSTVIDTITLEYGEYDITWGDGNLYAATGAEIWEYKGFSSEINKRIYSGNGVYGLAFDGKNLYSTQSSNGSYKINKHEECTGTIIESFDYSGVMPHGLAWDGENICISDHFGHSVSQQEGFSATTKYSFHVPSVGYLGGLTWIYYLGAPRARFISRLFPVQDGVRCNYPKSGFCAIISFD